MPSWRPPLPLPLFSIMPPERERFASLFFGGPPRLSDPPCPGLTLKRRGAKTEAISDEEEEEEKGSFLVFLLSTSVNVNRTVFPLLLLLLEIYKTVLFLRHNLLERGRQ